MTRLSSEALDREDLDGDTGTPADAYDGLPELLVEMAQVAGLQAAISIAQARGGNRAHIPHKAGDDHWLVQLVGRHASDLLMDHFGGKELNVPLGPVGSRAERWRRMYKMIGENSTSRQITNACGISRDTVKYHRAKLRAVQRGSNQLSIFDLMGD
jgi:hypothetical protein